MTERLLQYIWQFQYFNTTDLLTVEGQAIELLHPGQFNTNQGPDFLAGRIKVGNTTWIGNIELHIRSSDWLIHGHTGDPNYQNVILHVVWDNDVDLQLPFPVLELNGKISGLLLKRFDEWMISATFIPCEKHIHQVDEIIWSTWKERLIVERLQQKIQPLLEHLQRNKFHWEETLWYSLARSFGITVNADAFERIAMSLPFNLLAKHRQQLHQIEALLFGQAGLLETSFDESYPILLQKEYRFLQKKYGLTPIKMPLHFLRMRPSNFPTIRMAQLAVLVHTNQQLFSFIREADSLKLITGLLQITANDYWHYHYRFDEPADFRKKQLGNQMINSILVNTVLPMLFMYGHHYGDSKYTDKVLQWFDLIPPEKNNITVRFEMLGVKNKSALDSQALLQLKNKYCQQKHCLDCAIGNRLLKRSVPVVSNQ